MARLTADHVNHPPAKKLEKFDCVIDRLIKEGFLHWIKRGNYFFFLRERRLIGSELEI